MNIFQNIKQLTTSTDSNWKIIRSVRLVRLGYHTLVWTLIIQTLVIAWAWTKLPSVIPLWFSLPWGEERLAKPFFLLILPIGSLLWFLINNVVAATLSSEHPIFIRLLFLTNILINILTTIVFISIIFLV